MAGLFQLASPQRLLMGNRFRLPHCAVLALRHSAVSIVLPSPDCAELFATLEIRSLKLGARNARDIDIE